MDGDHCAPSGFGLGATAAIACGVAALAMATHNNIAEVFAQAADDRDADRVNQAFADLLDINADLKDSLEKERGANAALLTQFSEILGVAMKQHQQLAQLRATGLIA
jgi:Lon protease-like protein